MKRNDIPAVGILTFHRSDNYGALLQACALRHAIQIIQPKYEVNIIDYRHKNLEYPYIISIDYIKKHGLTKSLKLFFSCRIKSILLFIKKIRIYNFRSKHLRLSQKLSYKDLKEIHPYYDLIITGSDQIWNSSITGEDNDLPFTLSFCNKCKKVSYAASAGHSSNIAEKALVHISKLDAISVREQELKADLEVKLQKQIKLVLDPVFLLSKQDWDKIILSSCSYYKDDYIFLYCIAETEKCINIANTLAKTHKLRIVSTQRLTGLQQPSTWIRNAGPIEFLQLVKNAKFIVSSSFHATAFSIIFEKMFFCTAPGNSQDRITNLLQTCSLTKQFIIDLENISYLSDQKIDWNMVYEKLLPLINDSIDFLKLVTSDFFISSKS